MIARKNLKKILRKGEGANSVPFFVEFMNVTDQRKQHTTKSASSWVDT